MLSKTFLFILIVFSANASSTDDEIIKNLDFFQNMELLKNEITLIKGTTTQDNNSELKKEDTMKNAPEKE